ncbi:MAG: YidC/Oxa1 family membrane protein insertase [Cetobacterium sp.]
MEFLYKVFEQILIFINGITGNFGLAIIGLTILIKIILLPLTLKQDKSMKKMKQIQPLLEEYKEKYGNDKTLLNQKTMELYKEKNVNPAGGCLPLIVQLPILWALFGVLRVERGIVPPESFLWMNLLQPDPYYILPVLNGIVAFIQQKLTGTDSNPQMKQMMYIFPVMMIFISYKMPAGLQIYWLTSSFVGILQQYFIMKKGD